VTTLSLAVIELSDSFRSAWQDLAQELDVQLATLSPQQAPSGPETIAVLLAAGGEEDRALDLLATVSRPDSVPLYIVGAQTSHRFAVEAVRRGAADYFALPGDLNLLRRTLSARTEAGRQRSASAASGPALDEAFSELLGESPALAQMLEQAARVARHGAVTVLVQGETGTGKELLARALHTASPRAAGPFVAVNCAAIPGELMESELFGHERGAFTDAHASKPGLFEEAHGGTLFLDEVGHLPLRLQGKLLRALEEHRIRRVGATQSRDVDVRIITATHVNLVEAAQDGAFREDLFYRLNVITLTLPPLRDRGADVELLAEAFAAKLAERYELPTPKLSRDVRTALHAHPWPGNVRELRHAIERALLLSEPGSLDPAHFTPQRRARQPSGTASIPFPATLDQVMAAAARAALAQHDGNKSAAARQLGISRARLARLLELVED
jgi:DNA-binding NtrC family response regulator